MGMYCLQGRLKRMRLIKHHAMKTHGGESSAVQTFLISVIEDRVEMGVRLTKEHAQRSQPEICGDFQIRFHMNA
jgi:hypothetical protein